MLIRRLVRGREAAREALAGSAALLCDARVVAQAAEALGMPSRQITIAPWGVDVGLFHPDAPSGVRDALGWNATHVVLSTRSHEPLHRLDTVIDAQHLHIGANETPDRATVEREIARVPRWRHQIRLPGGVVTPGKQDTLTAAEHFGIPQDLTGLSVLDIGCSDGYFSFECERRGAARVLAVDDFSSVFIDSPIGFHVAHRLLGSRVEFVQADLFELDPQVVGKFDLVLFLGVLYHLRHPLFALERIATLCRGSLIIETLVATRPTRLERLVTRHFGRRSANYMEFYEEDEVNHDPTNWWAPSAQGMIAMLRACGFCNVQARPGSIGVFHAYTPQHGDDLERLVQRHGYQLVAHAAQEILDEEIEPRSLSDRLRAASIPEYAAIKQRAAELRAKQWHQHSD